MEKKKGNGKWMILMLSALTGVLCGWSASVFSRCFPTILSGERSLIKDFLIIWITAALGILLQTIIHEVGHLVCGLITGYRFSSFRIFSLMLVKKEGHLTYKKFSLKGTGGQCLMAPPDLKEGKIPYLLYNMGGILMNLIASAIFIFLYFLVRRYYALSQLCVTTFVFGVGVALLNGIPMKMGTGNNDGRNALILGKNPVAMRCFWIQMKISELITNGIRLSEMPKEWFAVPPEEEMGNTFCAAIGVFACNRAMDQMDFERARSLGWYMLGQAQGLAGIHRCILYGEMLFCELVAQNRPEEVQRLYEDKEVQNYLKMMKGHPCTIRLQYAYELLYRHDQEAAARWERAFEKVSGTYPHESELQGEREMMEYALKKSE